MKSFQVRLKRSTLLLQQIFAKTLSKCLPHRIRRKFRYFSKKTILIQAWIDQVVLGLQPFNVVENHFHPRFSKFHSMLQSLLTKHLKILTIFVEEKIAECLPSHLALAFDERSTNCTLCSALFAMFPFKNDPVYGTMLALALAH